eukprot:7379141-Prymnesium_polylepis.1
MHEPCCAIAVDRDVGAGGGATGSWGWAADRPPIATAVQAELRQTAATRAAATLAPATRAAVTRAALTRAALARAATAGSDGCGRSDWSCSDWSCSDWGCKVGLPYSSLLVTAPASCIKATASEMSGRVSPRGASRSSACASPSPLRLHGLNTILFHGILLSHLSLLILTILTIVLTILTRGLLPILSFPPLGSHVARARRARRRARACRLDPHLLRVHLILQVTAQTT